MAKIMVRKSKKDDAILTQTEEESREESKKKAVEESLRASEANPEDKKDLAPLVKLTKDLRNASRTLNPSDARYLVDRYYQIQQYRTSAKNQLRSSEGGEPNEVIQWFGDNFEALEKNIKRALDAYTSSHPVGVWCKCAPAGSMVMIKAGRNKIEVPIESLANGDSVISYNRHHACLTAGRPIEVNSIPYSGILMGVQTSDHQTFTTPNHKWIVRMKRPEDVGYIVYLMQKNNHFRVGSALLYSPRGEGFHRLNLQKRLWKEQADKAWILGRFSTNYEAITYEQFISTSYGLSEWPFMQSSNSKTMSQENLDIFFQMLDSQQQQQRATQCLRDHGRHISFPLFTRDPESTKQSGTYCIETATYNIMPEIMEVQAPTDIYAKMDWLTIDKKPEKNYSGNVYSMNVEQHHKYVQDGLVTCNSIIGIGPTFAAGLLAHIDAKKAPTAGAVWSYAGYNPNVEWLKGQKRPWNADLKKLMFLVGESFVKVQNNPNDVYGKLYKQRKIQEVNKNIAGDFEEQAVLKLDKFNIGKDTDAYKWYAGCISSDDAKKLVLDKVGMLKDYVKEPGTGTKMLPPAHINERSKRYAVKLFLAHFHEIIFEYEFGIKPPNPYAISILGHAHKLEVPNYDVFKKALDDNPAL